MIIRIITFLSYLAMIIVNMLANALPINNLNTGQISDFYPNFFAPAGITFSIWGLIYLLLGAYSIYQLAFIKNNSIKKITTKINPLVIFSFLFNTLWVFLWHYQLIGASVIFIIIILISLIRIADILRREDFKKKDYLLIKLPFSVYFGWITVATIANITAFLVSINWGGLGISDLFWTVVIIIIGSLIGLTRMFKDSNIAYGVVFIWAYLGIIIKHLSASGFNSSYPLVIVTAAGSIITFIIFIFKLVRFKK
jgi:hypothetical protein